MSKINEEPLRTMLLFAMCLGLRFSELIAVQWRDFDWLISKVRIQRAAVRQRVGDVKTKHSRKPMPLDPALTQLMLGWRSKSEFNKDSDWIWASPAAAGENPLSYSWLSKKLSEAAQAAGLGALSWHDLRHSYRSWLDETGAPISVQQRLMRHADAKTTMTIYGDALPDSLRTAHSAVVKMALPS